MKYGLCGAARAKRRLRSEQAAASSVLDEAEGKRSMECKPGVIGDCADALPCLLKYSHADDRGRQVVRAAASSQGSADDQDGERVVCCPILRADGGQSIRSILFSSVRGPDIGVKYTRLIAISPPPVGRRREQSPARSTAGRGHKQAAPIRRARPPGRRCRCRSR